MGRSSGVRFGLASVIVLNAPNVRFGITRRDVEGTETGEGGAVGEDLNS
ncbi:hypothetical protein [uncultured Tateyamaria sp.]|nr:hypothetical protein [uncultured Tateyamaria sp.]